MNKSTADTFILGSNTVYIFLIIGSILYLDNASYSGDAAGKGLSAGYELLIILGACSLIGLIILIINCILLNKATSNWIKVVVFTPILIPIGFYLFS